MATIEARGLRKTFRNTVALDGVDLRVRMTIGNGWHAQRLEQRFHQSAVAFRFNPPGVAELPESFRTLNCLAEVL